MSPALTTTEGAITQLELPSRAFGTHLTVRSGILKRYLKETFCLSFPFICSPGASTAAVSYKLRNAHARGFGVAVRFLFFFPAVVAYSYIAVILLTVAVVVLSGAPQG